MGAPAPPAWLVVAVRRWQPPPGELREGDRFLMATVVANGVSIPSTVVVTDAGIWLSPHLLSAGLNL